MAQVDLYRQALRARDPSEWVPYLTSESGLPGPRANLSLMRAVAEEGPPPLLRSYAFADDEYLAACGTVGLGRLMAQGDPTAEDELRGQAQDGRWRVREAVAIALQLVGETDPDRALTVAEQWAGHPSLLVRRAAVAAACEPFLVAEPAAAVRVLDMLGSITSDLALLPESERRTDPFRVLRQALGYGWSVAVAAAPDPGFDRLEQLESMDDPDVRWIVHKNAGKARIRKADPIRFERLIERLQG